MTLRITRTYDFAPRERGMCSGCGKRRLLTPINYEVAGKLVKGGVCNDCLAASDRG